jgi:hypothetical protein
MSESLKNRFLRWLAPDQRRTSRHCEPPIHAYLGIVRTSQFYEVGDISVNGFYMVTSERWVTGTEFPVTLEKRGADIPGGVVAIALHSKVVRIGPDGVGFAFVWPEDKTPVTGDKHSVSLTTRELLAEFLGGIQQE